MQYHPASGEPLPGAAPSRGPSLAAKMRGEGAHWLGVTRAVAATLASVPRTSSASYTRPVVMWL